MSPSFPRAKSPPKNIFTVPRNIAVVCPGMKTSPPRTHLTLESSKITRKILHPNIFITPEDDSPESDLDSPSSQSVFSISETSVSSRTSSSFSFKQNARNLRTVTLSKPSKKKKLTRKFKDAVHNAKFYKRAAKEEDEKKYKKKSLEPSDDELETSLLAQEDIIRSQYPPHLFFTSTRFSHKGSSIGDTKHCISDHFPNSSDHERSFETDEEFVLEEEQMSKHQETFELV